MTEHFVTVFDSTFATRGLALFRSLRKHCPESLLWVFAGDSETFRALKSLNLVGMKVMDLRDFEKAEMEQIKKSRTRAEYFWTLTPQLFGWVFDSESDFSRLTYVDADLWILRTLDGYFEDFERSEGIVAVTEHAYFPPFDQTSKSGRFCVQFLTMVKGASDPILAEWKAQCVDWCFARHENGKFGDQGYLNAWPEKYGAAVFMTPTPGIFQGPWNAFRFDSKLAMTFHFHGFLLFSDSTANFGPYPIPRNHKRMLYRPYFRELEASRALLDQVQDFSPVFDEKAADFLASRSRFALFLKVFLFNFSRNRPLNLI